MPNIIMADERAGTPSNPYVEFIENSPNNYTAVFYNFDSFPDISLIGDHVKVLDFSHLSFTSVPNNALSGKISIVNVIFPESLTTIGETAFYNCSALALTELPETLTTIKRGAFFGCRNLKITKLPAGISSFGEFAFSGCTGLVNLEIASARLGTGAKIFENCTGLESVWIRTSCETISSASEGNAPFVGCSASLAIYAEPGSKPSGWEVYFNRTGSNGGTEVAVTYGQTTKPW